MQQLKSGTLLQGGKYRIERVLGQGGFGITYLATHVAFQEYVAIKEFFMRDDCLRLSGVSVSIPVSTKEPIVKGQKEKFKKEARRLFLLQSEHIVRVHDMFEENNTVYYVMEHIDGETLGAMMKRTGEPFTESVVHDYLIQILDALKEIHYHGYEHLDIKPANLMLNSRGCLKVIDFGASKQMSIDGGPTIDPTACCYTPGYAPSEQEGQFVKKFGPWTDFYALGATLYNLLTNKKPPRYLDVDEDGENAFEFTSAVSSEMREFILWMMRPKREQRPQTVNDIYEHLQTKQEPEEKTLVGNKYDATENVTILNEPVYKFNDIIQRLIDNMVHVEGGTFKMGKKAKWYEHSDSEPIHNVTLTSYSIGKYEVTQEEWDAVMGTNSSFFKGGKLPVENVNWEDCQTFINKLNDMTGKKFRLPTEAEWEYAARGGNRSHDYDYAGSNVLMDVAWYDVNSGDKSHSVGSKQPNELGLYDMSGNVWEWCQDWYGDYRYSTGIDPKGPDEGTGRVLRGGSWYNVSSSCIVTFRNHASRLFKSEMIGFRLAL